MSTDGEPSLGPRSRRARTRSEARRARRDVSRATSHRRGGEQTYTVTSLPASGERRRPKRSAAVELIEPDDWLDLGEGGPGGAGRHRAPYGESRFTLEFRVIGMVLQRDLAKFWRSKVRIASGFAQPLLFLLIFGFGMQSVIDQTGGVDFAAFVFPGVVAMSVLGRALAGAVVIVQDGQAGFLKEMLVAPASRVSIVIGTMLGGAVTATIQASMLFIAAPIMGVWPTPLAVIGALLVTLLMSAQTTALGVALATLVRKPQNFAALTQTIMYPMLVFSGCLFPMQGLPEPVQWIAQVNPFTYPVDALRRVFLAAELPGSPLAKLSGVTVFDYSLSISEEILISGGLTMLFVVIAAKTFGRVE